MLLFSKKEGLAFASDGSVSTWAGIKPDASNLAAVLTHLTVTNDPSSRQYSFSLEFADHLLFSSRVISDGTLRLLALLTILDDPQRQGTLCFEEPENGVHEGRVPMLVQFLRDAALLSDGSGRPSFQVLINTHSPKVMSALHHDEIVAADSVAIIDATQRTRSTKTRMRPFAESSDLVAPESLLSWAEVELLLQHAIDAA